MNVELEIAAVSFIIESFATDREGGEQERIQFLKSKFNEVP